MQINEQIRDEEVRVVAADGAQLGLMSAREAQEMAYEKNMDLVKIAPQAKPPVCKIMDYGKYKFELSKKEKERLLISKRFSFHRRLTLTILIQSVIML